MFSHIQCSLFTNLIKCMHNFSYQTVKYILLIITVIITDTLGLLPIKLNQNKLNGSLQNKVKQLKWHLDPFLHRQIP